MKWKNSKIDGVPKANEQVLISIHGVFFVAIYKTDDRKFEVPANGQFFWIDVEPILWQNINSPGDGG